MSNHTRNFFACDKHIACDVDICSVRVYEYSMIPHQVYKQIGAIIKARRKTLNNMKQEKLAGLLGISRGSLANIETGRQGILVHQLYKFSAALQLKTPIDLLP